MHRGTMVHGGNRTFTKRPTHCCQQIQTCWSSSSSWYSYSVMTLVYRLTPYEYSDDDKSLDEDKLSDRASAPLLVHDVASYTQKQKVKHYWRKLQLVMILWYSSKPTSHSLEYFYGANSITLSSFCIEKIYE